MPCQSIDSPTACFSAPKRSRRNGLIAVGGDLDPARVLLAYYSGIFPWFSDGQPILWWSPNPRTVLRTKNLRVPRSLAKRIRRGDYRVTMDQNFEEVIRNCQTKKRPEQTGTWITDEMLESYIQLHKMGFAHSVETWSNDTLVGGLYGVSIGRFFAGESMFAHQSDASKFALVYLVRQLERWQFPMIDCQMHRASRPIRRRAHGSRQIFRSAAVSVKQMGQGKMVFRRRFSASTVTVLEPNDIVFAQIIS